MTVLRHIGRAVYLYSTAHKTQLTTLQLEDFLHTSLFPDLLPQPLGGFINNIFRDKMLRHKLNHDVSTTATLKDKQTWIAMIRTVIEHLPKLGTKTLIR
jgi:hypothetical protein